VGRAGERSHIDPQYGIDRGWERVREDLPSRAGGSVYNPPPDVFDALAWYLPIHYYGYGYGIYIRESAVLELRHAILSRVEPSRRHHLDAVQGAVRAGLRARRVHHRRRRPRPRRTIRARQQRHPHLGQPGDRARHWVTHNRSIRRYWAESPAPPACMGGGQAAGGDGPRSCRPAALHHIRFKAITLSTARWPAPSGCPPLPDTHSAAQATVSPRSLGRTRSARRRSDGSYRRAATPPRSATAGWYTPRGRLDWPCRSCPTSRYVGLRS
jgi:hypothetical protein